MHLKNPGVSGNPNWSYTILIIAFVFNLVSMFSALKAFNRQRKFKTFRQSVIHTKDPSTIIVLLGDFGDLLGLVIAFLGIYLGRLYNNPYYDGIASMIIGLVLIVISALLIKVSQGLLLGETTTKGNLKKVVKLTEEDEAVTNVKKHFSTYLAPEEIILQLNTVFKEDLTTVQITDSIIRITKKIQKKFLYMKQIYITPVKK